jgi:hypothetical protein
MSSRQSIVGKLVDLREVTRLTGTLDELQVRNLEMWGRLLFHPAKFGLNWDGARRVIEYDALSAGPSRPAKEHEAYMQALDTSVKEMLGDEWQLIVKETGSTIFTGPRKVPFKAAPENVSLAPERGEMKDDARGKGNS